MSGKMVSKKFAVCLTVKCRLRVKYILQTRGKMLTAHFLSRVFVLLTSWSARLNVMKVCAPVSVKITPVNLKITQVSINNVPVHSQ